MPTLRSLVVLAAALTLSATAAFGFGGSNISGPIKPVGKGALAACNFEPYNNAANQEAEVTFNRTSSFQAQAAGGTYFVNNTITSKPGGAITVADLLNDCDFSSVTIVQQNGADGTYASDSYMGITFRGVTNGETDMYEYEIGISGQSSTVRINSRVLVPANTPPSSNAGPDQNVASAASVSLDGTGSSANDTGQSLTYAWTQTAGGAVSMTGATTATPSFTAHTLTAGSADQVLNFQLVVNDGVEDSPADTVQITVTAPPNTPATADAGPDQTVATAAAVSLDGSASSANDAGQSLTYAWMQTGGTSVSLSGASTASPSFTAPALIAGAADEVLTFRLIVNDGVADSAADNVQITVAAPANTPATANAGPDQTVASAATVTLDGSGSSANDAGQSLTYAWTQTSGSAVGLSGANTASPSFTAPTLIAGDPAEVLTFELMVNDGVADSTPDTVQITISSAPNTGPIANAGPDQTVGASGQVTLDGGASSANDSGQTLSYAWTQIGGTSVTLDDASTAAPAFTAPDIAIGAPDEVLTLQLVVNDGVEDSPADTVTITVSAAANTVPTADAGADQVALSGDEVTLDGSASTANDPRQDITFTWRQIAGPSVALDDPGAAAPAFTAPELAIGAADVTLSFRLVVDDGIDSSAPDTVTVTVRARTNTVPTANAGSNFSVMSGSQVRLDGSASSANDDGQALSFAWQQVSGPRVALTGTDRARPAFTAPTLTAGDDPAALVFELVVNDGIDPSAADRIRVTVTPPVDNTPPTAELSFAGESFEPGSTVTIGIRFSEAVTGLETTDLHGSGRVLSLSGSGASYSARILTPDSGQDLVVRLPAGAVEDLAGNASLAAEPLRVRANLANMARRVAAQGMRARGQALILAQPRLRDLIGGRDNRASAMMLRDTGEFDLAYANESGWWIAAQGQWSDIDGAESSYGNLAMGAQLMQGENNLLGVMLQVDRSITDTSDPNGRFEGNGWLLGPYWVGTLPDQPLTFSASYLYGKTDNTVTLPGLTEDDFGGTRQLLTAGVEGQYLLPSNRATLIPSLDLAHLKDSADAYTDSRGDFVAGQDVTLTEARFGLGIEVPVVVSSGGLMLRGAIAGTYSLAEDAFESDSFWRGGLDIGADYDFSNGGSISLSAFYDGIGQDDYEALGASLVFHKEF